MSHRLSACRRTRCLHGSRALGRLPVRVRAQKTALMLSGGQRAMSLLCRQKGCRFIAFVLGPQGKDDPDPDIGQGSDCHAVTFACLSLSLVIGFGPGFEPDRFPGKLMQGVAEWFDTRIPLMHPGVL